MTDMRLTAQQLAAKGRYGDTMLLHVSPAEVHGIASLIPGGLTINPETGLPEAFFFLPFLASLFGAAAPAATAAAAAAPAVLGTAATTAATAGTAAATGLGALGSSLASIPSALAHGIGSMFGAGAAAPVAAAPVAAAAPAAASLAPLGIDPIVTGATAAAPAATTTVAEATPTFAVGAGAPMATPPLASNTGIVSAVSPIKPVVPPTSPHLISDLAPKIYTPTTSVPTPLHVIHPPNPTVPAVANPVLPETAPTPTTKPGGIGSGLMDWVSKNPMLALGGLSMFGSMLKGSGKKKDDDDNKDDKDLPTYQGGDPSFPGSDYSPGHSGEWNYFPRFRYANGGIVSLANGGPTDPQMQQPQDQSFPLNGVPGTDEAPALEDIPSSDYPSSQIGSQPEPPPEDTVRESSANDKELIAQAVEVLKGQSTTDPRPILLAFVQTFGEQALQDLAQRVKGMGAGDGQSDSVPAMIDGKQPAALSQGEFVVPADAVSHLGNGSTDAGAKHLQGMVDNVRQSRTGSPTPPPKLNGGGLVSLMH